MSKPISCADYDYFEIACTLKLNVEITLISGERVIGISENLKILRNEDRIQEQLLLSSPEKTINLNEIRRLKALDTNPHFDEITFPHY